MVYLCNSAGKWEREVDKWYFKEERKVGGNRSTAGGGN